MSILGPSLAEGMTLVRVIEDGPWGPRGTEFAVPNDLIVEPMR